MQHNHTYNHDNHRQAPNTHTNFDQNPQPIPAGWLIYSYILLLEERVCECCNSIHPAPSLSLRVGLVNKRTRATRTISLPDLKRFYNTLPKQIQKEYNNPVLPREVMRVTVHVPFCQDCFEEIIPEQEDFFQPPVQLLTPSAVADYTQAHEVLLDRYGREPTASELGLYKVQTKKDAKVKKAEIFNLEDFL